jgi:vitamin B12 transporter
MSVGDVATTMRHASRTLVLAAWAAAPLAAQDRTRRDTVAQPLPAVRTTTTRYESDARDQARRIQVITRDQIDRTPALEVVDVLKKRATVDVIQFPGQLSGIGIRGFRPQFSGIAQRSLILIDGRPSGATNLSLLDLGAIERIEVIKGPAASLYGSNAMGGVVNLITRQRTGTRGGTVALQGGSFGTSELLAQAGGRLGAGFDADLSLRRLDQRDNFRIGAGNSFRGLLDSDRALKSYPAGNRPSRFVADTIGDGRERRFTSQNATGGTLRIGRTLGSNWRIDLSGEGYRGDDIPNPGDIFQPFPGRQDIERLGSTVDLRGTIGRFTPRLRLYRADERADSYNRPDSTRFVSFVSATRTDGAQLQTAVALGAHTLVIGSDLSRVRASSERFTAAEVRTSPFSPDAEIRSNALFAEGQLRLLGDRITATAGGRLDQITLDLRATPFRPDVTAGTSDFSTFNPSIGMRARVAGGLAVHTSAGRAFVAPDPFGRAGRSIQGPTTGVNVTIGNPTLAPERSTTIDAGLSYLSASGAFDGDLTYFATDVADRSVTARATFTGASRPRLTDGSLVNRVDTRVNAGEATIRGLELSLRYDLLRALGKRQALTLFTNGTRIFRAREAAPSVVLDGSRFANLANFDPAAVFGAAQPGAVTTSRIRNVADLTLSSGLEYDDRSRWSFSLLGRYVGRRLDTDFSDFSDISDIEYPRYGTVDATAGLRLTARLTAQLSVANATDENIYEVRGYSLAGRTVAVRLTTHF